MAVTHPEIQQSTGWAVRVDFRSVRLTDEQFYRLATDNPELRIELTAEGELLLMSPTGSKTGHRNASLNYQLFAWAKADGSGMVFDSSTLFSLSNGAKRSPDASWVRKERWNALSAREQETFSPLCPDFVAELRSPSDVLAELQTKMEEYMACGASLGWLLDPFEKHVHVYRPERVVEILDRPEQVQGEGPLKGFALDLQDIL